jgi:hypothetical protein
VVGGEAAHVRFFDLGRHRLGVAVAGLDGFGHAEVLVRDSAVGDARVGERHAHRPVTEERGDRLETHAPVDRLGRQRVAQLVWMHMTDTGSFGGSDDVAVDGATIEGLSVVAFDEPPRPRQRSRGEPVVDELDEQRMQRHVTVVVELADRDAQPVGVADAHHGVGLQRTKLTGAHPGASEQFDHQPSPLVRVGGERGHELRGGGVVEGAARRAQGSHPRR